MILQIVLHLHIFLCIVLVETSFDEVIRSNRFFRPCIIDKDVNILRATLCHVFCHRQMPLSLNHFKSWQRLPGSNCVPAAQGGNYNSIFSRRFVKRDILLRIYEGPSVTIHVVSQFNGSVRLMDKHAFSAEDVCSVYNASAGPCDYDYRLCASIF